MATFTDLQNDVSALTVAVDALIAALTAAKANAVDQAALDALVAQVQALTTKVQAA